MPRQWSIRQTALGALAALLIGVFVPMNLFSRVLPLAWLVNVTDNAHNILFVDQIGSAIGAYDFFGFPWHWSAAGLAAAGPTRTSDRRVIRGIHVLGLAAIALSAVTVRATEFYATRYQSLPVLDWLESRPPLAEAANVPASDDLARGLVRALPLLTIREDARPELPSFSPPAVHQRTMGGVRDASRIELGSPGAFESGQVPVRARLDVIVFNRTLRAAAWSELMAREMDIRDPDSGFSQVVVAGPEEQDGVWLLAPRQGGGTATVAGHRGPVGFMLQVFLRSETTDPAELVDLNARAETIARQGAADWSDWLTRQLSA